MSTTVQETSAPSGRRIALVIGVNGLPVPGRSPLKYAEQDATEMAQVLKDCGYELFRSPLVGEQATTGHVKQAVLDLAEELDDHDVVLFYFSGHGEPMTVRGNVDDVYFVTQNFNAAHVKCDTLSHF